MYLILLLLLEFTPEQSYRDFRRLMDVIYSPHKHTYIFHVDVKSDPKLISQIHEFGSEAGNCHHIMPRNIAWAGLSTGEMMLALMHEAYERSDSWEYFVLIGHESFPLTSLAYTENFLYSQPKGSNFVHCMRVDGYDFFGQWENVIHRMEEIVVDDFQGVLIEKINKRRKLWSDITFYKGIQLVVLSRDFVR